MGNWKIVNTRAGNKLKENVTFLESQFEERVGRMGITVSLQKSKTIVMQNFGGYTRCIIVYVKTGE